MILVLINMISLVQIWPRSGERHGQPSASEKKARPIPNGSTGSTGQFTPFLMVIWCKCPGFCGGWMLFILLQFFMANFWFLSPSRPCKADEAKALFPEEAAKSGVDYHWPSKIWQVSTSFYHDRQSMMVGPGPCQASQFDSHHSFIVRYTATEDLGLDMHTDDSATGHEGWVIFGTFWYY